MDEKKCSQALANDWNMIKLDRTSYTTRGRVRKFFFNFLVFSSVFDVLKLRQFSVVNRNGTVGFLSQTKHLRTV